MPISFLSRGVAQRTARRALGPAACSLMLLCAAQAAGAVVQGADPSGQPATATAQGGPGVSAALEQCLTTGAQSERSATFAGEMAAIGGTARMSMRIDIEERRPHELLFHTVASAGLGVWRVSDPKVKIYKYLKQVTNLSSPAAYRALVRFRWMTAKGYVIRRAERFTPKCTQPAPPPSRAPSTSEVPSPAAT
jgi:hypothetical protein